MIKKVKIFVEEMDRIDFEKTLPYLVNKAYKIDEIYNPNKSTKLLCFKLKKSKIGIGDIVIKELGNKFTYCRIESIEVEHMKYSQFETEEEASIGIMLDKTRKPNENYWIYSAINI